MFFRKFHLAACAALLMPALAAEAETTPTMQGACQVFEHKNFKGKSRVIKTGWVLIAAKDPGYRTTDSSDRFRWQEEYARNWNDDIGSVKVGPRCTLTLHEHVAKQGKWRDIKENTADLGWWNDEAGRAACLCR